MYVCITLVEEQELRLAMYNKILHGMTCTSVRQFLEYLSRFTFTMEETKFRLKWNVAWNVGQLPFERARGPGDCIDDLRTYFLHDKIIVLWQHTGAFCYLTRATYTFEWAPRSLPVLTAIVVVWGQLSYECAWGRAARLVQKYAFGIYTHPSRIYKKSAQ